MMFIMLTLLVAGVIIEIGIITFNGHYVAAPSIPRGMQSFGTGPTLTYVVMGDSTAIGQGTDYAHSYARQSAEHIASRHTVNLVNVGISGATAQDVVDVQLRSAIGQHPDIVLLAVGANDATHGTTGASFERSVRAIVTSLRIANPNVQIVVTGSPDMGSVARFPWPAKQLAGLRTRQINRVYARLIPEFHLIFAPIAEQTGPAFRKDPSLFAADKFHPNTRGYALWTPIVNRALDDATRRP